MTIKSIVKIILDVVKVFVPVFVFFAAVGGVAGYNARQEVVKETLLKEIKVKKQEGAYVFEYVCSKNNLTFIHSVDDNTGEYVGDLPALASFQKTALALPTERFNEYRALFSGILGGATGGVKLRSVLKKPPGGWSWSQVQKTIIGIIGSITGYYAGYWFGSHYNTDCDSKLVASVLKDSDTWLGLERARLLVTMLVLENLEGARVAQTGRAIYTWDEDPAFMCSPKLKSAKERLTAYMGREITDPTSEHFHLIDNIAHLHTKISHTPEYRTLVELKFYKHFDKLEQLKKSGVGLEKVVEEKEKEWDRACSVVATIGL